METPCLAVGRHNTDTNQTGGNCLCVYVLAAGRLYTRTTHSKGGFVVAVVVDVLSLRTSGSSLYDRPTGCNV
jgi:hypothetical protein